MSAKEDFRRIVRTISSLAWIAFVVGLTGAVSQLGESPEVPIFILGLGSLGFAVLQGTAWIVAGFSGTSGLLWPKWKFRSQAKDDVGVQAHLHPFASPGKVPKAPPRGVGGWLCVLVVGMLLLGPLTDIGQAASGFSDLERAYPKLMTHERWLEYKWWAWAIITAACLTSILGGLALCFGRTQLAVTWAITALWARGPAAMAAILLANVQIFGTPISDLIRDPQIAGPAVGGLLLTVVWTWYLRSSRRVANTYLSPVPSSARPRKDPSI